jgi:ABC-type transport system involved in Fe-S cluster assembly fused permease/ATPase subunit
MMLKMLCFYDVENGSIKIDEKAISVARQNSFQHSIGIVVQLII